MTPQLPILELVGVRKTYQTGTLTVEALRGIDMSVQESDYIAIMGPSGSGKSTLMHILGCLDVPSAGVYRLAGEDVGQLDERRLADIRNRRIGFVFQQFNLLPALSAWRNVELPLVYAGVPRARRRERAIAALGLVGLEDRIDHKPGELSGGQQPQDVLALFAELHAQGRTIVLITHEHEVAEAAARTLVIRDGEIVDVIAQEEMRAAARRSGAAAAAAARLTAGLGRVAR